MVLLTHSICKGIICISAWTSHSQLHKLYSNANEAFSKHERTLNKSNTILLFSISEIKKSTPSYAIESNFTSFSALTAFHVNLMAKHNSCVSFEENIEGARPPGICRFSS